MQEKEFKLIGTLMYLEEDFKKAIRLISEKKINLDVLKTVHFGLDDMEQAYKYIEDHKATSMKVLIDISD